MPWFCLNEFACPGNAQLTALFVCNCGSRSQHDSLSSDGIKDLLVAASCLHRDRSPHNWGINVELRNSCHRHLSTAHRANHVITMRQVFHDHTFPRDLRRHQVVQPNTTFCYHSVSVQFLKPHVVRLSSQQRLILFSSAEAWHNAMLGSRGDAYLCMLLLFCSSLTSYSKRANMLAQRGRKRSKAFRLRCTGKACGCSQTSDIIFRNLVKRSA